MTFQRLNETARHLGAVTKFTATQAGKGWNISPLPAGRRMILSPPCPECWTLRGRCAGPRPCCGYRVDTMQAFGLDASTATHAADVFAYAQANANTNVKQMGEAMK
ncbi:phage tail tape measure protein [Paenibacillus larvae]|nr:phage tail tape measure protein [Paenibacillus larvae]MDT2240710.1 phage tail tape measure protein [Paenibacillus larvae]